MCAGARIYLARKQALTVHKMAVLQTRVQYLDDIDPFNSTNFPEPTRPPSFEFLLSVPLCNQVNGVKRLLKAPHKVSTRTFLSVRLLNVMLAKDKFIVTL